MAIFAVVNLMINETSSSYMYFDSHVYVIHVTCTSAYYLYAMHAACLAVLNARVNCDLQCSFIFVYGSQSCGTLFRTRPQHVWNSGPWPSSDTQVDIALSSPGWQLIRDVASVAGPMFREL